MMRKSQICKKASDRVSGKRSSKWHDSDALSVLGVMEGQQSEQDSGPQRQKERAGGEGGRALIMQAHTSRERSLSFPPQIRLSLERK